MPDDLINALKSIALAGAAPYIGTERAEKLAASTNQIGYGAKDYYDVCSTPREREEFALDREHVEGVASAFQLLLARVEAARPHLKSDQARKCFRDLESGLADLKHDTSLAYVTELCCGEKV